METDLLNQQLYASETDFSSYGLVLIYSANGSLLNAFVAGVTPGKFAFDYRNASGISKATSDFQFLVFPNPASNQLTIACTNADEKSTITITSMDGKILFQNTISENNYVQHIDISKFSSGTYLFTLQTRNRTSVQKIVKY